MFALLTLTTAAAVQPISIEVEAGRLSHGVVSGVVDASVEQIVDRVLDCDDTDRWFPELQGTHTLDDGRCAGTTNVPWPVPDRTWAIDVWSERTDDIVVVPFAYVPGSGNLAEMHGSYTLERLDDGRTLVTYEAFIDLGFWVPEPLVAWATKRVLPGILEGLEDEASAPLIASVR